MLQTSAALGWILAVSAEWFIAFGVPFPISNDLSLGLWVWVLLVHGIRAFRPEPEEGRSLVLTSVAPLLAYVVGLRFAELRFNMPVEYVQSRRAELLSIELHGIPWLLLLVVLGLVPGALLLARWISFGTSRLTSASKLGSAWLARTRLRFGPLKFGWVRYSAAPVALAYLGLTLLVVVRYGSGALAP